MIELLVNLGLNELLATVLFIVILAAVLLTFFAVYGGFATYFERRLSAKMQSRVGPNRVGPQGLLQWLADGVKLIIKEEIEPEGADMKLFKIAPYVILMGVFACFVVLPWGANLIPADLDVGLLYIISVTALVVVAILMAGWASNSKWALLGGMRSAAQIVSYEIPVAMGLLPVILSVGSLSFGDLMAAQGFTPTTWLIFQSPFITLGFFIFFVGSLAEANRVPFDLPEAESELVAGFFTEYSGFRFAVFSLAEFGGTWIIAAMTTAIFLGGGQIPASWNIPWASPLVFLVKTAFVIFLLIWLRWTLPRFRIDQMMEFSWKYLLPLSFIAFFGQAIYQLITYDKPMVQYIVAYVMVLSFMIVLGKFIVRVLQNYREQATPVNSRATDKYLTAKTEPVATEEEATVAE